MSYIEKTIEECIEDTEECYEDIESNESNEAIETATRRSQKSTQKGEETENPETDRLTPESEGGESQKFLTMVLRIRRNTSRVDFA